MSEMFISNVYYDNTTYTMLLKTLTDDDKEYIKQHNEQLETLLYKRWSTIINALPHNYYNQYYSQTNSQDRNAWFQRYLDYPTKNILDMPEIL
jgi:hypothetical protein